jgi:N-methylhydantoinase A
VSAGADRVELDARLDATGAVATPLTDDELDRMIAALKALDVDSVAVSLLHSYVNPAHEKKVAERLQAELPDLAVSLSADLDSSAPRRSPPTPMSSRWSPPICAS